jgi:hypothetical protein
VVARRPPRPRWAVLVVVALLVAVLGFLVVRDDGGFRVGAQRQVTVDASTCWRAFVEVDGTRWGSPSSAPIPAAWGLGSETGVLERTSSGEAVFTSSADGRQTTLFGGEGEQFFDTACPLAGRRSP